MTTDPTTPRNPPGPIERLARVLTDWTGSTPAFFVAFGVIAVWAATGWAFDYGDSWQLFINTGTTIVTFLMVFLIQRSQNKDSLALHLKLNELVAATRRANNRLVNVEDLSEAELHLLHQHYAVLAELARREAALAETHSSTAATARHARKRAVARPEP